MNFANVKAITIPEGDVKSLAINGTTVWQKAQYITATWNQQIQNGNFQSDCELVPGVYSNHTVVNNTLTLTLGEISASEYNADYRIRTVWQRIDWATGDRWYVRACVNTPHKLGLVCGWGSDITLDDINDTSGAFAWVSTVPNACGNTDWASYNLSPIRLTADNGWQVGDSFQLKSWMAINLTQMFGAGNEPSKAEFERQLVLNGHTLDTHWAYNSGESVQWRIA